MQAVDGSAAYGSACKACAKAKCRCIFRGRGERCERCYRLDKACLPSTTKRRLRPDNVRTGRVSRPSGVPGASRIERKLDDLVSMLSKTANPSIATQPTVRDGEASRPELQHLGITAPEADAALATFASHMFKFLPYVYVPPAATASELRTRRPFLLLCMVAMSTKKAERQRELFDMIRETIAQKLILKTEPSIDLLLGLLTFLGWLAGLPRPLIDTVKTTSTFMRLATSTVIDLGLYHSIQNDPPPLRCFQALHFRIAPVGHHRTMEERRAVLACFVLSFGSDTLRWTPYMGECLQALEREQESSLDAILVQQVKINRIIENASLALSYHATFEGGNASTALPSIYVQSLQADLDRLKYGLPAHLYQNLVLEIFHNTAKLQIRYMAIPWTDSHSQEQPSLVQLRNFSACVDLIETVFTNFHTLPLPDYIGIPYPIFTQLRLCLGMLLHLSTMDCPGWDKMEIRRRIDVLAVIDQMVSNFGKASALYCSDDEKLRGDDPLGRIADRLHVMRNVFAAKVEQNDGQNAISALTPTSAEDLLMTELPDMADFLDFGWLDGAI